MISKAELHVHIEGTMMARKAWDIAVRNSLSA